MKNELVGYAPAEAIIAEMTADGVTTIGVDVPLDKSLVQEIVGDDTDPMFVTIEVVNNSVSNNGRYWSKESIMSIMSQINSKHPDGYLGHLKMDERSHKYPDPQTIWLGATVTDTDGKLRLFAKGYVLPEAKSLRSYLKKAKAAGKNVAVSVYGKVKNARKLANGVVDMSNFLLESIDWARPGSEGVPNAGNFMIAAEMTDIGNSNEPVIKESEQMDKIEALKSATASELKEHNPEIVAEMTDEAVSEVTSKTEQVVQEMTEQIDGLTKQLRDYELKDELGKQVKSSAARKVIQSMVVAEMTDDESVSDVVSRVVSSEAGQSIITHAVASAPEFRSTLDAPAAQARRHTVKKV